MVPITISPTLYPQYWAEFRDRSLDLISARVTLTKTIIDQLTVQHVNLLTIGPGAGKMEDTLVKETGLNLAYYHAVERDPTHIDELEKTVKTWGVEYQLDNCCFTKDFTCSRTFDLVLMSNVMYYIPDSDRIDVVTKAISMLAPGGKVIIILQGEVLLFTEIKVLEEMTGFKGDDDYYLTGKSFAELLEYAGLKCTEITLPAVVEVHDFVTRNTTRDKWSYAISFLLQTDFDDLDKEVQDKLVELVKEKAVVNSAGIYVYSSPESMIVLEKYQ